MELLISYDLNSSSAASIAALINQGLLDRKFLVIQSWDGANYSSAIVENDFMINDGSQLSYELKLTSEVVYSRARGSIKLVICGKPLYLEAGCTVRFTKNSMIVQVPESDASCGGELFFIHLAEPILIDCSVHTGELQTSR